MLKSVKCETCSDHHHNYWECSECGNTLGGLILSHKWRFCPYCGKSLTNDLDMNHKEFYNFRQNLEYGEGIK